MGNTSRIIAFLVLVIGSIVFLSWIIFKIGKPATTTSNEPKPIVLTDYATTDSQVVYTYQGRIVGDDAYREARITIDQNSRLVQVIQGYQGHVIKSHSLDNNPNAYRTFIYALSKYNFATARKTTNTDSTGACPLGYRFIYDMYNEGKQILHLWGSTCTGVGTTRANTSAVNQLFQNQITGYSQFISGVAF